MPLCARSPGLSCELSLIGHHSRSGNLGAACALLPLSVLTNCARSLLRLAAIVRIAMWLRRSLYASRHADARVVCVPRSTLGGAELSVPPVFLLVPQFSPNLAE